MAKNRDKQKENKRSWAAEEYLNSKTEWNSTDPTPQQAVKNIIESERGKWN